MFVCCGKVLEKARRMQSVHDMINLTNAAQVRIPRTSCVYRASALRRSVRYACRTPCGGLLAFGGGYVKVLCPFWGYPILPWGKHGCQHFFKIYYLIYNHARLARACVRVYVRRVRLRLHISKKEKRRTE